MVNREEIKDYWNNQALKFGTSHLATDPDTLSEQLEILNVQKYIRNNDCIADIGCGNGYFAISCIRIVYFTCPARLAPNTKYHRWPEK